MKFLVLSKPVPGLPPPEDPEAFFKESNDYLDAMLKHGVADCVYITPDGGGMAVMDVESHEKLWEVVNAFPGTAYLKHSFYPLLSHSHYYDTMVPPAGEYFTALLSRLSNT